MVDLVYQSMVRLMQYTLEQVIIILFVKLKIVLGASEIPKALIDQLANGGRMVDLF